jgi:hypothetical protein
MVSGWDLAHVKYAGLIQRTVLGPIWQGETSDDLPKAVFHFHFHFHFYTSFSWLELVQFGLWMSILLLMYFKIPNFFPASKRRHLQNIPFLNTSQHLLTVHLEDKRRPSRVQGGTFLSICRTRDPAGLQHIESRYEEGGSRFLAPAPCGPGDGHVGDRIWARVGGQNGELFPEAFVLYILWPSTSRRSHWPGGGVCQGGQR